MFKQSFIIILIQILGFIISLLSVYFVAGDMGPEIYSLVSIYTIISGIVLTFSHLGIETTMIREALYWKEQGEDEKIKEYATQSIVSRCIGFLILTPILIAYLAFMNYTKYDGQYTMVLFVFYIGSFIKMLNDSMSGIVRSEGGYVFSQLVRTLNGEVMGTIIILTYIKWGTITYLYMLGLSSIPVLFMFVFRVKKLFSLKYIRIKPTIRKIKGSKYLWLRSYLDYVKTYADGLLVSLLFPPVILGNYAIYKKFEGIQKSGIEGFFDVLCQRTVKFKGQFDKLCKMEKKINLARFICVVFVILIGIVFSFSPEYFVKLVNLTKYENVTLIVYAVLLVALIHILGKMEINMVSLFASSKMTFKIGIAILVATVFSFVCMLILPNIEGVLLQRILAWLATSAISMVIFYKYRSKFYTHIYK